MNRAHLTVCVINLTSTFCASLPLIYARLGFLDPNVGMLLLLDLFLVIMTLRDGVEWSGVKRERNNF